jgi:hypothetical protein
MGLKSLLGASLLAVLLASGCSTPIPPDPNDPKQAGMMEPEVLRRNLKGASDAYMDRVRRREISDRQFQALIASKANQLLENVKIDKVDTSRAWEYGEVFRTAKRWKEAEQFLEVAVENAIETKNEDRRVNDLLRLAHAQVMQTKIAEGLKTARRAFDASDEGAAPILPATLLEIAPNAAGKGHDPELAKLLLDAIVCHERTKVDASSEAGSAFMQAKPFHIRRAFQLAEELYRHAGKSAEALAVQRATSAWAQRSTSA